MAAPAVVFYLFFLSARRLLHAAPDSGRGGGQQQRHIALAVHGYFRINAAVSAAVWVFGSQVSPQPIYTGHIPVLRVQPGLVRIQFQ